MKASTNDIAYCEAWLDTPFGSPLIRTNGGETRKPRNAAEAFATPGCHVKSHEKDGMWPRYFGRLTSYDREADLCIVSSKPPTHGLDGKPTVWTGSFAEYAAMWKCD
jgi:hypothetical protein